MRNLCDFHAEIRAEKVARRARILAAWKTGEFPTIRAAARSLGVSATTVSLALAEAGIRPLRNRTPSAHLAEKFARREKAIQALWEQGLSASAIAERLACGAKAVTGVVRELRAPGEVRVRYDGRCGGSTKTKTKVGNLARRG